MNYEFVDDIRTDKHLKPELRKVIEALPLNSNFDRWILAKGYNEENHKYSGLAKNNRLLVAVSLWKTTLIVKDKKHPALLIGDIFFGKNVTLEFDCEQLKYELFKNLNDKYENIIDFIYTYQTSQSIKDLAALGLHKVQEKRYCLDISGLERIKVGQRRLNLATDYYDKELLSLMIKHCTNISQKSLDLSQDYVMRYYKIIRDYQEHVYYLESLKTIVVLEFSEETAYLIDVFSKAKVDLIKVIQSVIPPNINYIEFGFHPVSLTEHFDIKVKSEPDEPFNSFQKLNLYARSFGFDFESDDEISFPLLSRNK